MNTINVKRDVFNRINSLSTAPIVAIGDYYDSQIGYVNIVDSDDLLNALLDLIENGTFRDTRETGMR